MRLPHHSLLSKRTDAQMTPMIDVVFLLIIFFVCTASFQVPEKTLSPDLLAPGVTASEITLELPPELEQIILHGYYPTNATRQSPTGQKNSSPTGPVLWSLNGQSCATSRELQQLLSRLASIDASLPVILDVEGNVPLGAMIDTYDLCRRLKFNKILFAAKKKKT